MDYEKKYNEALERAKNFHSHMVSDGIRYTVEEIFPELAESEDERTRKCLLKYFEKYSPNGVIWNNIGISRENVFTWLEKQGASIDVDSILNKVGIQPAYKDGNAWCILYGDNLQDGTCGFGYTKEDALVAFIKELLEKQGEQNPTNKAKPKFNVGDWIIFNEHHYSVCQVERIYNYRYYLRHYLGGSLSVHFDNELIRLWTIQDAKDGDVLVDVYGNTGVFKKNYDFDWISYCSLGINGGFQNFKVEHENDKTHPATKEQRDILFAKMKEAGYEWDEEEKELRNLKKF